MKKNKNFLLGILAFVVFLLAAIYITYPLIFHMTNQVTGFGDELVITWIQNWVIHALMTNPIHIFEANLYYPYHNTLAFTETFILTSILALPARLITGEPISTVNFTLLTSIAFLGFSIYLLSFYLTKNFILSLFSGILVIFSPATLDYSVHLQVLSLECVPLSILFLLHFIKTKKTRFLSLSLLFFVLQMYNSIMPGYFILFSSVIILIFFLASNRKKVKKLISFRHILLLFVTLLFLIPIAIPYYSVSNEFHYVRDIKDAVHLSLQPEDFVYPGIRTRLNQVLIKSIPTNNYSQNFEFKPAYLGIVFSFLVLFAIFYVLKNFKKTNWSIKSFFTIALVGLILSLGPVLHLGRHTVHQPFVIPLPYTLFYYILPGFQGLRNAARWDILFIVSIAIVITLILDRILAKSSWKKQLGIIVILTLGLIVELNPITLYKVPQIKEFPPVYAWIAQTKPDSKIIELPSYNWNMDPFTSREIWREYYGTEHFRRTVNGYTGFSPPPWQIFVTDLTNNFPSGKTINDLRKLKITYIVIHTDEYDALHNYKSFANRHIPNGQTVLENAIHNKSLHLVTKFKDTFVFKL